MDFLPEEIIIQIFSIDNIIYPLFFVSKTIHKIASKMKYDPFKMLNRMIKMCYDDFFIYCFIDKIFPKNKYRSGYRFRYQCSVCAKAAFQGQSELLFYLRRKMRYRWDNRVCASAILGNHFELLKLCHKKRAIMSKNALFCAVYIENEEIIKWCIAKNFMIGINTCMLAAEKGYTNVIKYFFFGNTINL